MPPRAGSPSTIARALRSFNVLLDRLESAPAGAPSKEKELVPQLTLVEQPA